jgi:hypothetical protein
MPAAAVTLTASQTLHGSVLLGADQPLQYLGVGEGVLRLPPSLQLLERPDRRDPVSAGSTRVLRIL